MITFGSIPTEPNWSDRPVIIVGAGPSLKEFPIDSLKDLGHTVAVNGAMLDMPWADAWVTMDCPFIDHNHAFLSQPGPPLYIALASARCVGPVWAPEVERATYVRRMMHGDQLSSDPRALECGGTSGYTALNFAYLRCPQWIYLFGFDYQELNDRPSHYCPDRYNWRDQERYRSMWKTWSQMFNGARWALEQMGIRTINASLSSVISAFPKMDPYRALEELTRHARQAA